MALCPGQDTRYWRPGDIFDVTCGNCGSPVEFFKDDIRRRCRSCGTIVQNPKITLGCAQWCEHAKECLGYDPAEALEEQSGDDSSILTQLEHAMKAAVAGDAREQERIALSFATTDEAKMLLRSEEADRRIVLAAATVMGAIDFDGSRDAQQTWAPMLLEQVDLDGTTRAEIIDVVTSVIDEKPELAEARVLRDALWLANISQEGDKAPLPEAAANPSSFMTETGRTRAGEIIESRESRVESRELRVES